MAGRMIKIASLFLVAMTFAPSFSTADQATALPTAQATINGNVVYIIQGETSVLTGSESNEDFYELHIVSYELPWNVSRVYAAVPTNARNISVFSGFHALNSSSYGRETAGPLTGSYGIDVPSSHNRTTTITNTTDGRQDFEVPQAEFINTSYASGYLALLPNQTLGQYTSQWIAAADSVTVLSANLSWSGLNLGNVTAWMSNNNGSSWVPSPTNATEVDFPLNGTSLRIRLELRGNATEGSDARISKFSVSATCLLVKTIFPVHISYRWTSTFSDGKVTLNLTEPLPYASDGSLVVMLYLVKGYTAVGMGVDLEFDRNGSMSVYEDKDLYLNMSRPIGYAVVGLEISTPPERSDWALFLGIGVAVLLLGCVVFLGRRRWIDARESIPEEDAESEEIAESHAGTSTEEDAARKKELVSRKKTIMSEMESVREDVASGKLGRSDSEKRLGELKTEFKQVRNEINRLERRRPGAKSAQDDVAAPGLSEDAYVAALSSLARIDDDFDRGRLPEGTYKSLRRQYLEKAAALRAEKELSAAAGANPLELEKVKLMEAIVALDEEHDAGELDEKVYQGLQASYRAELAEVLRKMEQMEKGD